VLNLTARATPDLEVEPHVINGQPGVVYRRGERALMATAIEIVDGVVVGLYTVVNPEKLSALD
jgi:hypothetical protein